MSEKHKENADKIDDVFLIRRSLFRGDLAKYPSATLLFVYLIGNAEYRPRTVIFKNKKTILERGQLLTGYRDLARRTGLALATIQRGIAYLTFTERVSVESDTLGTIITVLNYNRYQLIPKDLIHFRYDGDTDPIQLRYDDDTEASTRASTLASTSIELTKLNNKINTKYKGAAGLFETAGLESAGLDAAGTPELDAQKNKTSGVPESKAGGKNRQGKELSAEEREERARNIERATWVKGIWTFQKSAYVQLGFKPATFPALDGEIRGRFNNQIAKRGDGDIRLGVAYMLAAADTLAARYSESRNEFWFPSPGSMLHTEKLNKLLANCDINIVLADIPATAQEFLAQTEAELEQSELQARFMGDDQEESNQPREIFVGGHKVTSSAGYEAPPNTWRPFETREPPPDAIFDIK